MRRANRIIPEWADKIAQRVIASFSVSDDAEKNAALLGGAFAAALVMERERCAKIADDRAAICADAVAKIEAGELYQGIPTALASEDCARLEALHIAGLIRGDHSAIRSVA